MGIAAVRTSYGNDRYGGMGEDDFLIQTRDTDGFKPGLIVCHGRGDTAVGMMSRPDWTPLYELLAERYTVVVGDVGGPFNWGGVRAQEAMEGLINYLIGWGNGPAAYSKIGVVGISMGNLAAMNFAKQYPHLVAFVASVAPVLSIQAAYSQYSSEINTALGGTYSDAGLGQTYSPYAYRFSYPSGVRTAIWMSQADEAVGPQFPGLMKQAVPAIDTYDIRNPNGSWPNHLNSVPAAIAGISDGPYAFPAVAEWCNDRRYDLNWAL